MKGHGFETLVVTGVPDSREGDMTPELEATGARLITLPHLSNRIHFAWDLKTLKELRKIMLRFRPRIVHTHTAKAGFLGRLASRALKPPPIRIHTFHGHVLDSYFGPVRTALFRMLERRAARSTDAFIAVAPSVRDELVSRHGVGDMDRFHIIPSGRSGPAEKKAASLREELGLGEAFVVGWVGRLVPIKGVKTFLDAIPSILDARPGTRFVIVGDGPLRSEVETKLDRSPWKESLHYLRMRKDMDRVLATLDALSLTSLKEGLPTVLVEAALAGVPCVAPRIPGVHDLFTDQKEACLFDGGSRESLAKAVLALADDEAGRSTMVDHARERVLAHIPDYAAVAKAHASLYNALLGDAPLDAD